MEPHRISSAKNIVLKRFRRLARGNEPGLFLIEGRHVLEEALRVEWPLREVLLEESLWDQWRDSLALHASAGKVYLAPKNLVEQVSRTASPEGVLASGERKPAGWPGAQAGDLWLYLDAVQDPANVGMLVRSATAFGLAGVFCGEGTADPFHPTALSRSAGAAFHLLILPCALGSFLKWAEDKNVLLMAANARGEPFHLRPRPQGPAVLALGNEGRGLSAPLLEACHIRLAIPMLHGWDSLNVAVAGSLILFALSPYSRPHS